MNIQKNAKTNNITSEIASYIREQYLNKTLYQYNVNMKMDLYELSFMLTCYEVKDVACDGVCTLYVDEYEVKYNKGKIDFNKYENAQLNIYDGVFLTDDKKMIKYLSDTLSYMLNLPDDKLYTFLKLQEE